MKDSATRNRDVSIAPEEWIGKYIIKPALYGVIVFLPFSIALSEIFIFITILGVLAHLVRTREYGLVVSSLMYAVAGYILISFVSALLCKINPRSMEEVIHLLLFIFMFACIYIARKHLFDRGHIYMFAIALIVCSLNGMLQYFNDTGFLGRRAPRSPEYPDAPVRIRGTFSNSLTFTGVIGLSMFFLLPFLRRAFTAKNALVWGSFAVTAIVLIMSHARGAMLAAVVTFLAYYLFWRKHRLIATLVMVLALAVSFVVFPELNKRFSEGMIGDDMEKSNARNVTTAASIAPLA